MNAYEQYMKELAQQMRSELTDHQFESLETSFASFCSATATAAGRANPAAQPQVELITTKVVSLSAGQDKEATATMREYIQQVPSSPSFALFKGQNLVHFMPREHIEHALLRLLLYLVRQIQ
jgi:putative YphP/YqiW family bacilliredoxin